MQLRLFNKLLLFIITLSPASALDFFFFFLKFSVNFLADRRLLIQFCVFWGTRVLGIRQLR